MKNNEISKNTRLGLYRLPPRDAPRGDRLPDTTTIFEFFLHAIAAQLAGSSHDATVATGPETPSPEGSAGVRGALTPSKYYYYQIQLMSELVIVISFRNRGCTYCFYI